MRPTLISLARSLPLAGVLLAISAAFAQTTQPPATSATATGQTPATQPGSTPAAQSKPANAKKRTRNAKNSPTSAAAGRPDATYPNPSGQDSQPRSTNSGVKSSNTMTRDTGTVESRGTRTDEQAAPAQRTAGQKAYTGNSGKKADPGTACSTARPTPNGGVDCGTSGTGATPGKVPK
jgi:hypothetical protein